MGVGNFSRAEESVSYNSLYVRRKPRTPRGIVPRSTPPAAPYAPARCSIFHHNGATQNSPWWGSPPLGVPPMGPKDHATLTLTFMSIYERRPARCGGRTNHSWMGEGPRVHQWCCAGVCAELCTVSMSGTLRWRRFSPPPTRGGRLPT